LFAHGHARGPSTYEISESWNCASGLHFWRRRIGSIRKTLDPGDDRFVGETEFGKSMGNRQYDLQWKAAVSGTCVGHLLGMADVQGECRSCVLKGANGYRQAAGQQAQRNNQRYR